MSEYAFNYNEISKACAYGQTTTITVLGTEVEVVGDKDGYARLNASPFYQAQWTREEVNTPDSFTAVKGGVKYGYRGLGEVDWGSNNWYNQNSDIGADEIMLRYLDHFGNWQYWVMGIGGEAANGNTIGDTVNTVYEVENIVTRPQGKSSNTTYTLFKLMLTYDQWKILADINKSVHIAISKDKSTWVPVVLSSGASAWAKEKQSGTYQDFDIAVTTTENSVSI